MITIEELAIATEAVGVAVIIAGAVVSYINLRHKIMPTQQQTENIFSKENIKNIFAMNMEKNAYREAYATGSVKFEADSLIAEKTFKADTVAEVTKMINDYINSL